jgi:hypothetical protein
MFIHTNFNTYEGHGIEHREYSFPHLNMMENISNPAQFSNNINLKELESRCRCGIEHTDNQRNSFGFRWLILL